MRIIILGIALALLALSGCPAPQKEGPYYFIAIHNEPYNRAGGRQTLEEEYPVLEQIVERADQYNIKLTLMFAPQWGEYISESQERMEKLEEWKAQGHEIAAHRHSILSWLAEPVVRVQFPAGALRPSCEVRVS